MKVVMIKLNMRTRRSIFDSVYEFGLDRGDSRGFSASCYNEGLRIHMVLYRFLPTSEPVKLSGGCLMVRKIRTVTFIGPEGDALLNDIERIKEYG
jgi:hypothetical protein